jgi:hypothetical protein
MTGQQQAIYPTPVPLSRSRANKATKSGASQGLGCMDGSAECIVGPRLGSGFTNQPANDDDDDVDDLNGVLDAVNREAPRRSQSKK